MHKGSCVCGAVTFEVTGTLDTPNACHCTQCRKQSGHFWVSTAVERSALALQGEDKVTWYRSSEKVRRGFCATCGSFLFWEPIGRDRLGVAMGAFDAPTGVHLEEHIFIAEKGDYYDLPRLPPPARLEQICKGLAVLDAILSPEWDSRYYSFNAKWSADARMASMRNGSGDDYFMVFTGGLAFVKGFAHEYPRADPAAIFYGLPPAFAPQRTEPAFSVADLTYGGWFAEGAWTIRGDDHGQLAIPSGQVELYCAFAADYYEREVPRGAVAAILTGAPLDAALLAKIDPDRTLADLAEDLAQIGYAK
ncbi:MAG TPA: GFA family protein [Kofleriaceae bacterium]|nr:GFA family protein [Kofleriaceae bacterium]